jgi:hypothetical protein
MWPQHRIKTSNPLVAAAAFSPQLVSSSTPDGETPSDRVKRTVSDLVGIESRLHFQGATRFQHRVMALFSLARSSSGTDISTFVHIFQFLLLLKENLPLFSVMVTPLSLS